MEKRLEQEVEIYLDILEATFEMQKRIKKGWRIVNFSIAAGGTRAAVSERAVVLYEREIAKYGMR